MQKTHQCDAERPFVVTARTRPLCLPLKQECQTETKLDWHSKISSKKGEIEMTALVAFGRRFSRPAVKVVGRPRELFGESLPELLLLTAVVAAVISAVLALNG
jgi:hypothetical protein